ncbi:MAG: GTPase HflX [Bdellovibrionales bacterium]|nr:GTPase HflX [Bdellovibrionales bacterium]
MSPKFLTAAGIRQLARQRLKEEEKDQAPLRLPVSGAARLEKTKKALEQIAATAGRAKNAPQLEWMWGAFEKSAIDQVILAVSEDDVDGGEEMQLLCATLGLGVIDVHYYSTRKKTSPKTYVTAGFVDSLRESLQATESAALVIDAPLRPGQVRNLEEELKAPVVDRQAIILAIFEMHAKTKMAKMQVELARLKYLQPRLTGIWMGLSRQSGGKGGLGGRGQGETRLELDRRVLKERVSTLTAKLKEAEKAYVTQSSRRTGLPRVALVGYTNAGKSTLMRVLTRTQVEVENKLFCTLDTTVRPLVPPTQPKILVSDTVGFVRDLPHDLVASFRSTLREALDSQLILHVVDLSHPQWRQQVETTNAVLSEIGADEIPKILVLNKVDRIGSALRVRQSEVARFCASLEGYVGRLFISAQKKQGIAALRDELVSHFGAAEPAWAQTQEDPEA